jgi:hypothetical protein
LRASVKKLTVPKAASKFCSGFPSLSVIDFLQCTFTAGFREKKNLGSQSGGFRKNFRDAGGYQKAGASSKRVTKRIFFSQLVSDFIEASRNFILNFFTKRQLKIIKAFSVQSNSTVMIQEMYHGKVYLRMRSHRC